MNTSTSTKPVGAAEIRAALRHSLPQFKIAGQYDRVQVVYVDANGAATFHLCHADQSCVRNVQMSTRELVNMLLKAHAEQIVGVQ